MITKPKRNKKINTPKRNEKTSGLTPGKRTPVYKLSKKPGTTPTKKGKSKK